MMKIVVCMSSFRKHGNTADVVSLIVERLGELAAQQDELLDVEILTLGQKEIGVCQGCRVCFDRGEADCPLGDDMLGIKAAMDAADGLIVASPVYVGDVNGIMKNWIDRLAYLCHRPQYSGKSACLLATVGVGPAGHALSTLDRALRSWGYAIGCKVGFKTGARMGRDEIADCHGQRIERAAQRFFRSLDPNRRSSPSLLSLMIFRIKQRYWWANADDSLDYRFWKEQGWLEPDRAYYAPETASPIKVLAARTAGALLTPFVT